MMSKTLAALLFIASSSTAFADDFEVGARVGGYGFRRDSQEEWTECRMNGFGVFGGRALRGPLFVEAGIDMYNSLEPALASDLPIDRTSGLFSAAIGARTQVASWLRGYIQLGAGLELTSLSVPYGDDTIRDHQAMPEAFFGVGFDLKILRGTHGGASVRTLLMGNFDYDPARLEMKDEWAWKPSPEVVFDASPDVAAQVQFYVRREL